jgi:hypothetical protein
MVLWLVQMAANDTVRWTLLQPDGEKGLAPTRASPTSPRASLDPGRAEDCVPPATSADVLGPWLSPCV